MLRSSRRQAAVLLLVGLAGLAAVFAVPHDAPAQTLTRSVTLTWTAPGDDGVSGRASKYDFRYSAYPILNGDTLGWWNTAAVVNMSKKTPSPAGQIDSVIVAGLAIGKRYFAILRVADEASNWSSFSNIALIDLTGGVTAVENEGAPTLVIGSPYPSPTSGGAQIALELARSGPVSAVVFDARGRLVRSLQSGTLSSGRHTLRWDGRTGSGAATPAGAYWVRVEAQGVRKSVKLIVVH